MCMSPTVRRPRDSVKDLEERRARSRVRAQERDAEEARAERSSTYSAVGPIALEKNG